MNSKNELRKNFLRSRDSLDVYFRNNSDKLIFDRLINSEIFSESDLILTYVSVRNEVDTRELISYCFRIGKRVAVPYCTKNEMIFYEISSLDDLEFIQFGIPTVDISKQSRAIISDNTLCIVPALSFDKYGNRLGYGGGYYDRFFSSKNIKSVGLCREIFLSDFLPSEKHDVRIKLIFTENKSINTSKEVYTYE